MHATGRIMSGSTVSSPSDNPTSASRLRRRLPIGAEYAGDGSTHFRGWAPAANHVAVISGGAQASLARESDGYFSGAADALPGASYRFRIDDADELYPDPASRFQPDGPHGPSEV